MLQVSAYKRPASLDEALEALEDGASVLVGGGTRLNAAAGTKPVVIIDLQAAGLAGVQANKDDVSIGATTTLEDLAASPEVPDDIRDAARREQPSSLRTLSTLGGCVASGDFESELLAGLLVRRATVRIAARSGTSVTTLGDLLARPGQLNGGIITSVVIEKGGRTASDRVARTPADKPIVAVVARRDRDGELILASSGVARAPVLMEDPEILEPPSDFRGSSEYRKAMAKILSTRVREALL